MAADLGEQPYSAVELTEIASFARVRGYNQLTPVRRVAAMPAKQVFEKYLSGVFASVAREFDDWVESFDPLGFSRRYRATIADRYSQIKILGMAKPVSLAALYVDVVAYLDIPSRLYEDIDRLEKYLASRAALDAFQGRKRCQGASAKAGER